MTDHYREGIVAGFFLALMFYPIAVIIGAASVPFHRGNGGESATAGILLMFRWAFYLSALAVCLFFWGIGMITHFRLVGGYTLALILLGVAYQHWYR